MIDFREIQIVDNSFELTQAIAKNQEVKKNNNYLKYLAVASGILVAGVAIYLAYQKSQENSNQTKIK